MLKRSAIVLVSLLFLLSAGLFAQDKIPVIFVDNFKNLGKGNDAIGETLKRSLKMIVEITRKYDVIFSGNVSNYLVKNNTRDIKPSDVNEKYIEANFVRLNFDEVLYGTFTPYNNGDMVEIHIIVLTLAENKVKFDKIYRSATDADIFDAIDKIGLDLASVLVGRRLGIGSLIVNNNFSGADIFVDGIKSGKDRVVQNTAIAGLRHRVEVINKNGKIMFSRDFEIQDRGFYDVTFNYDETVEVIDETKITNRMKKEDYMRRSSGGSVKTGPQLVVGGGSFAWVGWFLDVDNLSLELNLTVLPRVPNYIYDWYIGAGFYARLYAFQQDAAWFNFYARLGIVDYYGLSLGFMDYSPFAYFGIGIQIMPNWSFMPLFMRQWKLCIEGGTYQDLGIYYRNFSGITYPDTKTAGTTTATPYQNIGYAMLSVSIKFPF
jgi:hypothetical protein